MAEGSIGQQEEIEEVEDDSTPIQVKNNDKGKAKDDENPATYKPRAPFPTALEVGRERKRQHIQTRHEEFMNLFSQVHINIPLLNAIHHVPAYAKFLKELCTQKKEPKVPKKIMLSEDVSAVLLNQLPQKMKDTGVPLISCVLGGVTFDKALLELGASVNLLPTALYQ